MSENIYRDIQEAVNKKFGYNCRAVLTQDIYPLNHEQGATLKVKEFEVQPDGTTATVRETFIQAPTPQQLPAHIKEFNP